MLPNDPMLALRAAQDTMATRQFESSQERLVATARLAAAPNPDRNAMRGFAVLVQHVRAWLEGHRPGRHAVTEKRETAIT
jgi:hypothetical protein